MINSVPRLVFLAVNGNKSNININSHPRRRSAKSWKPLGYPIKTRLVIQTCLPIMPGKLAAIAIVKLIIIRTILLLPNLKRMLLLKVCS